MKISAQEEYGLRCLLRLAKSPTGSATLPEVAAERRYETWLAGRRKPARIDWSFLNRSGHPAA